MNLNRPILRKVAAFSRVDKGFALVVTLSLMILLTVIAVGLLTLSSISLRSSTAQSAQATARANARMAMMLAIGELQKQTGPDQRVTVTSEVPLGSATTSPVNTNWTGVTDVSPLGITPNTKNSTIKWLVSGVNPDPSVSLTKSQEFNQGNALKLGTFMNSASVATDLLAPVVNITQGKNQGRYAWWIGDEGTKARVDVAKPKTAPTKDLDRLAQSQSSLEGGFSKLGITWSAFSPNGNIDKNALISMQTTSLAATNKTLATEFFNDITTGGHGLPVNVTTGGMKADLSLIFDKSQTAQKFGEVYCGATPSATTVSGATMYSFATTTPAKFFLSDAISQNGNLPTGPNWGNLWNYATLWQNVTNQQAPLVGANPQVDTDMRDKTWLPYTNYNQGPFRRDAQHTNSPLAPVLSMFQMSFCLSSELIPPTPPSTAVFYKPQITMQPVIGLWNPHNVTIRTTPYFFKWALYPFFRLNYARPTGLGSVDVSTQLLTRLWLRDEWTVGSGGVIPTPNDPLAGKYFSMQTETVDLQPGEFRLFSMQDKITINQGNNSRMKPGWSEKGGFVVNLKSPNGSERVVPKGYVAWFGDIVFQDTQSTETAPRYPGLDTSKITSTWFNVGTSGNQLFRTSELWNSEAGAPSTKPRMPEPVVSGAFGTGQTSKTLYLIDDLAGDNVLAHIATWSFFSRTTNQSEETNQRLRGWIDSNPRALVCNPLWDGSKVDSSSNRTGWNTISQWIGAYNPPGKPKVVGDGYGGNRGLLGEGGSTIAEPEVSKAGGRYQGFGGAANTLAGGRTNVIVYDVPRAPLVSLGQFQHAQLSRYNFEPGFVVGNSYANPRIRLGATSNPNFNGITGLNVTDTSYDVNRKL